MRMKKYALILLILLTAVASFFIFKDRTCPLARNYIERNKQDKIISAIDLKACQDNFMKCLKLRRDKLALAEIEKILLLKPDDSLALWGKAEIWRRDYKFKESEELLNQLLLKYPDHASSLISLSYIKYHDNHFEEALRLLNRALNKAGLDRESKALAYMLIGSINAKRASRGGFISKIAHGFRVQCYFKKAEILAPDLAEVRLGLGSFYLFAPSIAGGNLDKAIEELEQAVRLAPDFATANARLAQAYKEKGEVEKYNFYLKRTKELDPENEALKEIID